MHRPKRLVGKTKQVAMMRDIYQKAIRVQVYIDSTLNPINSHLFLKFGVPACYHATLSNGAKVSHTMRAQTLLIRMVDVLAGSGFWSDVDDFYNVPWLGRAWIV